MGIFDSVFGKRKETDQQETRTPWIPLVSKDQLDGIEKKSRERTQVIYKHSTTCGISSMVLRMFSSQYTFGEGVDHYFLDLHANRDVSNAVETKFQVRHQSPQLLIVKDGKVSFHASHGAIVDINMKDYI
ncbi:MAG: bacillithiol system redox-active protein YtxJ [Allomuricauda sp.]